MTLWLQSLVVQSLITEAETQPKSESCLVDLFFFFALTSLHILRFRTYFFSLSFFLFNCLGSDADAVNWKVTASWVCLIDVHSVPLAATYVAITCRDLLDIERALEKEDFD